MDLTRAVGYRGFNLNSLTLDANGNFVGCEVKRVEWPGVEGMGYSEKRALADGFDASDVFLGKRLIGLSGALYGTTRGEFFDLKQALVTCLTPTAAYDESPGDMGYLPLDYYEPTANLTDFPDGYIHKMVLVRPVRQPSLVLIDDRTGGEDGQPLALEWNVMVEAKDPRVYFFTPTIIEMVGWNQSHSGDLVNLGDYPSPLNILLIVTPGPGGTFHFVGGGADLSIRVEPHTYNQTYRYSARDKVLTYEALAAQALRMDFLTLAAQKNHPLVPVGTSAYSWSAFALTIGAGSRIWHTDAWA